MSTQRYEMSDKSKMLVAIIEKAVERAVKKGVEQADVTIVEQAVERAIVKGTEQAEEQHEKRHFAMAEKLLYAYPKLKKVIESRQEYLEGIYRERSKDFVSTMGAKAYKSREEILEEMQEDRESEYYKTIIAVRHIEAALKTCENEPGYRFVRMFYFNEDIDGNPRGYEKRCTWEEIAEVMKKDTKTVRRWRNQIVDQFAICIFGMDAIS